MSEIEHVSPEQVEREINKLGFMGYVCQLSPSACNDNKLVAAIAAAASKRNQLISDDDRAALSGLDGSKFFHVQSTLCEVIPLLQTEASELIELVQLLVDQGGEDLAANQPNASFRKWCEADLRRSDEILELAKVGNKPARRHLVFALQAKGDFDEAMACLERSEEEQTAGVLALSRIQLDASQAHIALKKTIALALKAGIKTSCGITRAAYDIAAKDEDIERTVLLPALNKLFDIDDPNVVHCPPFGDKPPAFSRSASA